MNTVLNDVEVRVLGSLIEKELTTPDYYPLTLNALTNACNQKSNRHPVVSYEETTVVRGLDALREKGLAKLVYTVGSRVPKYQHFFREEYSVNKRELAILCELMLRGPQTVGEIRTHAGRIYEFAGLEEVEGVVQGLSERDGPLAVKLPRQVGRKEQRYAHLLSGGPEIQEADYAMPAEAATLQVRTENERIAMLETELTTLRRDFDALKQAFIEFKSQF